MDNLENALAKITGTTECMREDLRQKLNCVEMRSVEKTYIETLEEVIKLITAAMRERKE